MNELIRAFWIPVSLWFIALIGIFMWGGWSLFIITLLLTILEVTLSFDNAVVNARVLQNMSPIWQRRFLTWGIFIAVFGTRFVLPIIIVAISVMMSPLDVLHLALFDAEEYGHLLEGAHHAIASFGGAFLMLVSLKYFLDAAKDVHWIHFIEEKASQWGQIEAIGIAICLALIAVVSYVVPDHASTILFGGVLGVILFILMQGVSSMFANNISGDVAKGSIAMFMYLEVLDAAFSLDGVVGAFALTSNIIAIAVGLSVGAYFVRSITVFLVKQKTLDELVYLEHGAHWAILGLAIAMYASLFVDVPEVITGLIGIIFVVAAYWSSVRERQKAKHG